MQPSNVWFDRKEINPKSPECRASLEAIYPDLMAIVRAEVAGGIALDRIVVGGFSMGGAMALHLAYHCEPRLRACFAISSFLNDDSIVYESLAKSNSSESPPPLMMFHGTNDDLVKFESGRETFDRLVSLGVGGEFVTTHSCGHEIVRSQVLTMRQWLLDILPSSDADAQNQRTNNKL